MVDTLSRSDQDIGASVADLSSRSRVWLLTVACMGVALVISSMVALNAALPDIAVETTATQAQLTWVVDGYTLVLACLLLPAGAIGDRYGRRGALLAGLGIFTLASGVPLIVDGPLALIIARAVAGVGAAFVMPATLSLLTAAYPKAERNKAVGIWAGVAGSSAVVGFLGSGVLLHFWSWQSIFWAFVVSGLGLFVLTCTVASSRDQEATPLDWPGAVLVGGAVAVFVYGVLEAPIRGWTHPVVYGCMAVGVALAAAFAVWELRSAHPLLDIRLFAKPDFTTGAVGVTFFFLANFGFFFVSMQYMQLLLGYSPLQTALALAPLMAPVLLLSITTPWYLPRLGLRLVVSTGLALIAAGLFYARTLEVDSPYLDLALPLLIMSTGIGLCTAPTTSAIMGAVPNEKQGVASAVNDTTREVGAALGIAVAGSVLAAQYSDRLAPHLKALPEALRTPASNSLAEALEVAARLGPQGDRLSELAQLAFLEAMHISLIALGVLCAVAAAFIALWAPGRDGRQFRFIERVVSRSDDELGRSVPDHDDGGVRAAAGDHR
ncbi:MFS transporter [Mycolicibacterium acapulense]|uniref:MFS transporter n=1 Tax=Mycobacterium lehmannii TaxID=2048550 RepID=A0A100ZZP3_9MYCO|nr:MFS transporter [Mycobacterium lehmannii]KUI06486.1 MFS transporter [Mycobacterium lehmannii]KUI09502.1 MFS transporter [Mycolicibacterium acapulense]KUI09794.1 MFS transporter [Mycolicibacterium acapulense]